MIHSLFRRIAGGLVGHAAVYVGAAALNAAIPFLLLPLIARWLGPADFGVIGSFVAIVNVLVLLVGLNAYGFVSVGYFRDGARTMPDLSGAAIAVIAMASLAVALAGWAGAGMIETIAGIDRRWLWTLIAAAVGQAILAVGLTVAQTTRRPAIYGGFQVGYGLSLSVLAVVLIGGLNMGWPGRALAQALAAMAAAAGVLIWLCATAQINLAVRKPAIRQALRFGIPLLPHSFAAVAMGSMDRLALAGDFTPSVVGHYFLALQISSVFTAFAAAVNQAWVPWLYERLARNDDAAWSEIGRIMRGGGALLVAGAVMMVLLAQPLVQLVGGQSYLPAVAPLRILALYAACQAWYTLLSAFLFYVDRTRLMSGLTLSVALVQGAAILVFVRWGAVGVAGALLVSSLFAVLVMSLVTRRLAANHRKTGSAPSPGLGSPAAPVSIAR